MVTTKIDIPIISDEPEGVAVASDGSKAYVSVKVPKSSGSVAVIDTASKTVYTLIGVCLTPRARLAKCWTPCRLRSRRCTDGYLGPGMARTLTASSTEVLAGLVDRVTFRNPENGFCVLRVKARGQRAAAVRSWAGQHSRLRGTRSFRRSRRFLRGRGRGNSASQSRFR
jgi:hypothetical protein